MGTSRTPRILVALALTAATGWAQAPDSASSETLQRLARSAVFLRADRVFKVEEFPSSGSGFFVHPDGYILTNWHVVADQVEGYLWEKEREISAKVIRLTAVIDSGLPTERELPAKILTRDRKRDLALVKVNYRSPSWVDIEAVDDVRLGDRIWTAGFPFGDLLAEERKAHREDTVNPEVTLVSGTVTSLRRDREGNLAMVQTDAALNPGSSGSPMVNSNGHLVGVVFAGIQGGQGLGFGVSPNRIRDFLKLHGIRVEISPQVVLSPPQPIEVRLSPILTELADESGWVELSGDDIDTVEFDLSRTESGLETTVMFPDRIPGKDRPQHYYLSVQLTKKIAGERYHQRFSLDAIPESFETLKSNRDPSEIMEDRKVLAHEMKIEDYNRSKQVSGEGGKSLADIAKEMKLKTDESGTVVLDNRSVGEIGGTSIDPSRYRLIEDAELRATIQRYDQLDSEMALLGQQAEAAASYDHYTYLRNRANEIRVEKRRIAAAMYREHVYQCRESKEYFRGVGDRDEYPCRDYTTRFD